MDHSFQHYLIAKQSVDDRAINRRVYEELVSRTGGKRLRVIEVGAGIGTMLVRVLRRGLLRQAEYVLVDGMAENIAFAREWIPAQAKNLGLQADRLVDGGLYLRGPDHEIHVRLEASDVFDFIHLRPDPADLLIAHAFLDLLPMPASLSELFSLLHPEGLAWLTINFDGLTSLEPPVEAELDGKIEALYHRSMDERPSGGDSRSGRHLFGHLRALGAGILAAGASDWVVYAEDGKYPADESYFLEFILHFFEESLGQAPGLEAAILEGWLAQRREQLRRGELVYIAHQLDYLVKPPGV